MVAPIRVTVPSSTAGSSASCWPRLKRWISSTKSSVPRPSRRRAAASANAWRRAWTPCPTADTGTSSSPPAAASRRPIVVLPVPGGPHRMADRTVPAAAMAAIGPSPSTRCACPTTSASVRGRIRSASGRSGAAASSPAAPNRSVSARPPAARRAGCRRPPASPHQSFRRLNPRRRHQGFLAARSRLGAGPGASGAGGAAAVDGAGAGVAGVSAAGAWSTNSM